MFLGFCYKGFHWPTILVIKAEGKEDKTRGGGGVLRKKFEGGCREKKLRGGGYEQEDKIRGVAEKKSRGGGCCENNLRGV